MSHKVTILQFRTDVSLDHEKKCFYKFFNMSEGDINFVKVFQGDKSYDEIKEMLDNDHAPLVIAGSGQYYLSKPNQTNEMQEDVENLKEHFYPYLKELFERNDRYIFGICFGHQIMVDLYGSLVTDEAQAETGVFEVYLTEEGLNSPLFEGVREPYHVVLGHSDSAKELPEHAKVLSYSERCKVQALQFTDKIYSVQYHPEMTLKELEERLKLYPHYKDHSSDDSMSGLQEITQAPKIMMNFARMAGIVE